MNIADTGNTVPHPEQTATPSQELLGQIVDLIEVVKTLPDVHTSYSQAEGPVYVSTPHDEARPNIFGVLVISDKPKYDPSSFLELRRCETGYGDDKSETEKVYTFSHELSETLGETLSLKASDTVSTLGATTLIGEQADFDSNLPEKSDPEMLEALHEDMKGELHEAFSLEEQTLGLTLKPATQEEAAQLYEMLKNIAEGKMYIDKEHEALVAAYPPIHGAESKDGVHASPSRALGRILLSALKLKRK